LLLFHVAAVAALFMFSWKALIVSLILYWVSGSLGIGIGYHRLLTHRGFKVSKPVEYFLTFCGALALEGGPMAWVTTHRIHHKYTDREGDPHSPRDGAWWSHAGWIYLGKSLEKNPEVMKKFSPDLSRSRFHVWLTKWYYVPFAIVGIALLVFGGVGVMMWGMFLRTVLAWHFTWFVNSAAHIWGKQRFKVDDDSRNNWWVALVSFGEGWHNNHHAHPTSARHGLAWYELDINWWGIRVMKLLGLIRDLRVAKLPAPKAASAVEAAIETSLAARKLASSET
jgi:stearoyl-CoA desaturase (delta-9 desaturase)